MDQIDELCYFVKEVMESTVVNSDTLMILAGDLNVDAHNYKKKREVKKNFLIVFIFLKTTKIDYTAEDEYKILIEKLSKVVKPVDIFKVI